MEYDLIILGGGVAGMTAAIYAGRYDMKAALVSNNFGGTGNLSGEVENWPSMMGSGTEIMAKIREQAEKFGTELITSNFESVRKEGDTFIVKTEDGELKSRTLIVALGTQHRKLGVPGEGEFLGKGVTYCATCDGNFFRGKDVAIIGGAGSAAKAAIYLGNICNKVYVVYRKDKLRAEPIELEKMQAKDNVEFVYWSNVKEIIGENKVEKIKVLQDTPEEEPKEFDINVDGVFIEIGADPSLKGLEELGLELDDGYIKTDKNTVTNIEGVFAAGDITNSRVKQLVNAAGEGAIAAIGAHEFLMKK